VAWYSFGYHDQTIFEYDPWLQERINLVERSDIDRCVAMPKRGFVDG